MRQAWRHPRGVRRLRPQPGRGGYRYGRRGVTRGRSAMLDGKHRVGAERLTIMDGHPGGHVFWWVPFALLFWFIWLPALIYVLRRGLWGRRDIGVRADRGPGVAGAAGALRAGRDRSPGIRGT